MKKSPNIEQDTERDVRALLKRMTPLERELMSRVGEWELKNGRHFDPGLSRYICRCGACKHWYLAKRPDSKTCGAACKKARQRAIAKSNFERGDQARFS